MGDALSKCGPEEPACGSTVPTAVAPPAAAGPAPRNRRRVKVTPVRIKQASSSSGSGRGGSRSHNRGPKDAQPEAEPQSLEQGQGEGPTAIVEVQASQASAAAATTAEPAPVTAVSEPASAAAASFLAPALAAAKAPAAHAPAAAAACAPATAAGTATVAGCKRKAPEPAADLEQERLAKRRSQLLGLTFLTLGALTGMTPFALLRPAQPAIAEPPAANAEAAADEEADQLSQLAEPVVAEPPTANAAKAAAKDEEADQLPRVAKPAVSQPPAAIVKAAAEDEEADQPPRAAQPRVAQLPAANAVAPGEAPEGEEAAQQTPGCSTSTAAVAASPVPQPIEQQPLELAGPSEHQAVQVPAGHHAVDALAMQPEAQAGEQQPQQEQQQQQLEIAPEQALDAEAAAATPLPTRPPPGLCEKAAPVAAEEAAQPLQLSAAKPLSRSQLRQQLQRQSQRSAGAAPSPVTRFASRIAGTPSTSKAAHGTRGQRVLGLAQRQRQAQPTASDTAGLAPASAAAGDGEQMQLDKPCGAAAAAGAQQQPSVLAIQWVQRRLTQSPLSRGPAAVGSSMEQQAPGEVHQPQAADALQTEKIPAEQVSPAAATTAPSPQAATPPAQRAAPPTPIATEPSSTPRPMHGAAPDLARASSPWPAATAALPGSNAPFTVDDRGVAAATLHQVDTLLAVLRGDSPPPPSWCQQGAVQAGTSATAGSGGGTSQLPTQQGKPAAATKATAPREDKAQSTPKEAARPVQAAAAELVAASPYSPPEVCSRPQEAGADNFPGFWRQPVAGPSQSTAPATSLAGCSSAAAGVAPGRNRKRTAAQASDESSGEGQGRERRVRFSVPEQAETEVPSRALGPAIQQQPQPAGPVPLVVAPPVLPSGRGDARAGTPAKPAQLPMPQPPPYSRFGVASAVFRKPYHGPLGRRQALLSFVSENGATCFAVPPGVPAAGAAEKGAHGGEPSGSALELQAGELFIPRRLQHREGLWRRRNQQLPPPPPRASELLEQELREAYMNAKLAGHAGESWARLDMAGCELALAGGHAEALAQLSNKLEEAQGPAAVQQLLEQLEAEWQHLKRVRQYATQGSAAAAAAPALPGAAAAQEECAATPGAAAAAPAAKPRGILKHRSSLSGSGQLSAAGAAAAGAAAEAAGGKEPPAVQQQAPTAGAPHSFEAILAADIVQEAPQACFPAAPAQAAGCGDVRAASEHSCVPMEVNAEGAADHAAAPAAPTAGPVLPPAEAGAGCMEKGGSPAAATPIAAAVGAKAPAACEPELSPEPRPVQLTPGPQLSRGAKMLQRLGTPVAANKVQQLLQSATGAGVEHGRKANSSTSLFAAPIQLMPAVRAGGAAAGTARPAQRRGMSRGERMLASVKGGAAVAASLASHTVMPPAVPAGQLNSQLARPTESAQLEAPLLGAEDGPTVASAAAVQLGTST